MRQDADRQGSGQEPVASERVVLMSRRCPSVVKEGNAAGKQDLGMDPYTVDKVIAGFGMPLGPFRCVPHPLLPPPSTAAATTAASFAAAHTQLHFRFRLSAAGSICLGAAEVPEAASCVSATARWRVVAAPRSCRPWARLWGATPMTVRQSLVSAAPHGLHEGTAVLASLLLPDLAQWGFAESAWSRV